MKKSHHRSRTAAVFAALLGAYGCAAETGAPPEASIETTAEEIIGGTNVSSNGNLVAMYHTTTGSCSPDAGDQARGKTLPYNLFGAWWPRPCSGTVIRKDGNDNYILTARHCITKDGKPEGTPIPGINDIKSISTLNPGVLTTVEYNGSMTVTGTPPAGSVFSSVYFSDYSGYGDLAIVKASGNLQPGTPAVRPGLMGFTYNQTSYFENTPLLTMGYGRNIDGTCYSHAISGAGRLRFAQPFAVDTVATMYFSHVEINATGQRAWHGDSGGPLYTVLNAGGTTAMKIFGVHHDPRVAAGGQNIADFAQAAFGRVYLTEQTNLPGGTVIGVLGVLGGVQVRTGQTVDNVNTQMQIDRGNGFLKLAGYCLRDEFPVTGEATVRLSSCGGPGTHWDIYPSGTIKARGGTRCMKSANGNLATEPCPAFPKAYTFVADVQFN